MRKHLYILLLALLVSPIILNGQTRDAFIREAEKSFESKDYFSAMSYYAEALEFKNDKPTVHAMAESARLFDAYSIATSYYTQLVDSTGSEEYPLATFYLGQMLQRQGKYDTAITYYNLYISETEESDSSKIGIARKEIEACKWAKSQIDNPKRNITVDKLPGNVNTPYSEFGAINTESKLYFSSLRFVNDNDTRQPPRQYSKNLTQDELDGIQVDTTLLAADTQHVAHTAFNGDETKMFYTLCEYLNDKDIRCDIYVRDRNRDGSWGAGRKLPEPINMPEATNTQPNIAYNENIQKEILYFVSDREGGKGEMDIWYSVIDASGNFSLPMNLSGINTPRNEFTPFYHNSTNTLYFSSDGYLGMGGYDVYKVYMAQEGWGDVINMGYPLNSSYHDVYFTLADDNVSAHMSSNRKGSLYIADQHEACCYDIYTAEILPSHLDLHAFTFDSKTLDSLQGVTLKVIDLRRGETTIYDVEKLTSSHFTVPIEFETEYKIIATRDGYDPAEISFMAPPYGSVERIDKLLYLTPSTVRLEVLTFDRLSELPLDGCTVRLFDLTTGDVVTTPPNLGSHEFDFEVTRGHRYEVIATKTGYTQGQEIFEVPLSNDGDSIIQKKLYLTPGLQDMLPIVLYFDNDHPDPRTYRRTTQKDYTETFKAYFPKKDTFVTKYAEAYENVSGTRADVEVTNFFDNEVDPQYERFVVFLQLLERELAAGRDYDIILKGFASPRASSGYNKILGARRIDCVRNEFLRHNNGALKKYIDNNLLRISQESIGEAEAPPGVSDDLDDLVNSVYSPEASKERRVEIIDVKKVRQ